MLELLLFTSTLTHQSFLFGTNLLHCDDSLDKNKDDPKYTMSEGLT